MDEENDTNESLIPPSYDDQFAGTIDVIASSNPMHSDGQTLHENQPKPIDSSTTPPQDPLQQQQQDDPVIVVTAQPIPYEPQHQQYQDLVTSQQVFF